MRINKPFEQRFWEKVDVGEADKCWPWKGSTNKKGGYGKWTVLGRKYYTHRLAYHFHYGVDPGDKFVCHDCDNPTCCNPHHLWLGTHIENMADKLSKGRQCIGSEHGRSLLNEAQVKEIVNLLRTSRLTFQEIGDMYGVSVEAISGIRNGVNWTHVTDGKVSHKRRTEKLQPQDVLEIRRLLAEGLLQREIATRFGVDRKTVSDIKIGKRWGWVQ